MWNIMKNNQRHKTQKKSQIARLLMDEGQIVTIGSNYFNNYFHRLPPRFSKAQLMYQFAQTLLNLSVWDCETNTTVVGDSLHSLTPHYLKHKTISIVVIADHEPLNCSKMYKHPYMFFCASLSIAV